MREQKTLSQRVEDLERKLSNIRIKKTYKYPHFPGDTLTVAGFAWICVCGKQIQGFTPCEHLEIYFE
jgi:hypothetical protein